MQKLPSKFITRFAFLSCLLLYVIAFFLPAYKETLLAQTDSMMGYESAYFVITIMNESTFGFYVGSTNFFVILLIIAYFTKARNIAFPILFSAVAFSSAIIWLFMVKDVGVLKIGYFVWVTSILGMVFSYFLSYSSRITVNDKWQKLGPKDQ